jgi:curved DNA-binding protein CbpA
MTTTTATDYYALLGVPPGATTAQIKSAYRKLAKQYHPDVNDSPDAAEKFREITEAYDTLTDPARRSLYDLLHGTGRTTSGDGERSRYTRPGNGTRTGNGSKDGSRSQAASPILKILEDTWLEIRRWHPDIPRPSSSSPAAPTASTPAGATTPPAGGTSTDSNTPKS